MRKTYRTDSIEASLHCSPLPEFFFFFCYQWCLHSTTISLFPSTTSLLMKRNFQCCIKVALYLFLVMQNPQIRAASGPRSFTFFSQMRRFFGEGALSITVNTIAEKTTCRGVSSFVILRSEKGFTASDKNNCANVESDMKISKGIQFLFRRQKHEVDSLPPNLPRLS